MTINSARSTAQLFAQVTPGDPTASGSYEMGATGSRLNFTDVNQVYALKVSNQGGDGDLNLKTGTYTTAGGATFAGGDGKDPDGQDVDLTNIYGIQVINTGDADLVIDLGSWTPGASPFAGLITVAAGSPFLIAIRDGQAITTGNLNIDTVTDNVSYEIIVLGKTGA